MYKMIKKAEKRMKVQQRIYGLCAVVCFIMLPVYFKVFILSEKSKPINVLGIFVWMLIIGFIYRRITNSYEKFVKLYKNTFVRAVLSNCLENVEYRPDSGFSRREVNEIELVRVGKEFYSEDYLKARYQGIEFEQADVCTGQKSDNSTMTIFFEGMMVRFRIKKKIMQMQLFSKTYKHKTVSYLCRNKIEMEDVEFNQMFDVYTSQEQDAFYILTPQLMEKFKEMNRRDMYLSMHIKENFVTVALWGQNSFEPKEHGEIECHEEFDRISDNIQNTIDILEVLNGR